MLRVTPVHVTSAGTVGEQYVTYFPYVSGCALLANAAVGGRRGSEAVCHALPCRFCVTSVQVTSAGMGGRQSDGMVGKQSVTYFTQVVCDVGDGAS